MTNPVYNVHPHEIDHFSNRAHQWWDAEGEFRTLHHINPVRLDYVQRFCPVAGQQALDVGCGGGILSEALAAAGAQTTGIDLAEASLRIARLHLLESGLTVDYRAIAVEELAEECPGAFDLITCMEMLEHVPDPASVVQACAKLLKPGGFAFFSTLNRNLKSYALAVVAAEYLFRLIPKGTHDYAQFIRPSELACWCRGSSLDVRNISGLDYQPFTGVARLSRNVEINYLLAVQRID